MSREMKVIFMEATRLPSGFTWKQSKYTTLFHTVNLIVAIVPTRGRRAQGMVQLR